MPALDFYVAIFEFRAYTNQYRKLLYLNEGLDIKLYRNGWIFTRIHAGLTDTEARSPPGEPNSLSQGGCQAEELQAIAPLCCPNTVVRVVHEELI